MSIFGRGSGSPPSQTSNPQPPARPSANDADRKAGRPAGGSTHLATGNRFNGRLQGTGDVVIDGEFEGTIQVEADVLVGTDGRVTGDIEGRSIRVAGTVAGNLKGLERVEILGSGKLQGDVAAPRVILAEGAFFRGNVEMTGKKDPKSDKPAADKTGADKTPDKAAGDKAAADRAGSVPATKGAGQ